MHTIENLINIILNNAEQLEEKLKQESDLKNLTLKQLFCIEIIRENENPTISELAEKLQITKPSISVMLERLEENGYVRRVKSDSDKRTAHVHLTEKGDRASHLHNNLHKRFAQILTKDLTESERDILIVLLNKAVKSINSDFNM
ncbi:MAG: MarR family transcriptional regulator [Bacteroidales bacterium]|nr:MarR family transcriptional regulator [Bacteroidales bacterium]MBN2819716.1 MarR family transcriptional regulator [Bacteroidales bacterium]